MGCICRCRIKLFDRQNIGNLYNIYMCIRTPVKDDLMFWQILWWYTSLCLFPSHCNLCIIAKVTGIMPYMKL